MAGIWSTTTTHAGIMNGNDSMPNEDEVSDCQPNYLPTISENREALGAYWLTMIAIGSVLTAILYVLFMEQIYFTYRYAHEIYRRHIYWIVSVYPFMTMMTLISVIMPRADTIASGIKAVYMCLGISHFVELTELMFGSEKVMLAKLKGSHRFYIATGPSCCFCPCLPTVKITGKRLRTLRWMVWQMPYLQAIYFTIAILWNIAISDENGMMDPTNGFLSIQLINLCSFLCGVWALNIVAFTVQGQLDAYGYKGKSFIIRNCVLVTRFQTFILDILNMFSVFPCYGPFTSQTVFKIMLDQSLYLFWMMILGPYTYWQFRTYAFLTKNPADVNDLKEFQPKDRGISVISKNEITQKDRGDSVVPKNELAQQNSNNNTADTVNQSNISMV